MTNTTSPDPRTLPGRLAHPAAVLARELSATATSSAYLILAAGALLGLLGSLRYAYNGFDIHIYGAPGLLLALLACAFTVVVFGTAWGLLRRSQPLAPAVFISVLVAASLFIRYLLHHFVQAQWGTDYLRYWQYATDLVETGRFGGFNAPYYARSLFFPYPVIRLFGPEATHVLKAINTVLLLAMQLMAYDVLRRVRSHQAAQAASVLLLAAPIPAYMTLIPSHDLWGTFFIALAAWLVIIAMSAHRHVAISIAAAFAAGVTAYAAEVQRGLGMVFCFALLIAVVLFAFRSYRAQPHSGARQHPAARILVAIVCLGAYLGSAAFDSRHLHMQSEGRPIYANMKYAANASGMGNGKSDWFARFRDRFVEKQSSAEEARDFSRSALLSAWSLHPIDNVERVAAQGSRLYTLTYPRDWDWLLRNPKDLAPEVRSTLIFYSDLFALAFGVLLFFSCIRIGFRLHPPPVLTALGILVIGISAVMLVIFENKPFNIFPIWIVGALLIGYGLPASTQAGRSVEPLAATVWHPGFSGLVAMVLLPALALAGVALSYSEAAGRWLSGWTVTVSGSSPAKQDWARELIEARPEAFDIESYDPSTLGQNYIANAGGDGDRIWKRAGDAVTRMQFPAPLRQDSTLTLSKPICIGGSGRSRLEFFVYSPEFEQGQKQSGSFTFDVEVDGRASEAIEIPLEGKKFQRFIVDNAFSANTCHQLSFRLHAHDPSGETGNGQAVEIWMPRLVH
ncbi:hypothetical protein ACW7G2_06325 [Luteimonas sp. A277]